MDSLSLILTILECLIFGSIFAAAIIAVNKLSTMLVFVPNVFNIFLTFTVGIKFIVDLLIYIATNYICKSIYLLSKQFVFSFKYIKYFACSLIKEQCSLNKIKTEYFTRHRILDKGSPGIRVFSEDILSSQSFLKISPIILQ